MDNKEELEKKKKAVKDTMCCPYCDAPLKKWEVPPSFYSQWPNEYFYICFNDECSYYVQGWDFMARTGNHCSYRLMYDPLADCCQPAPVKSRNALREGIVE